MQLRSRGRRHRQKPWASTLVLSLSIVSWPVHATATPLASSSAQLIVKKKKKKKKKNVLTPEKAESQRATVRGQAQIQRDAGDHVAAANTLSKKGAEFGDPVLFVDAAESLKIAGDEARDRAIVTQGVEQARTGLDILYFLLDERSDADRKYLSEDDISTQIDRAKQLIETSEQLVAEIKAEQDAPEEQDAPPEAPPKDGKGMIIAGSILTGVGVAGLGVMGAGIGMGASAQSQIDDPTSYGTTFDELDAKGKSGNILAFVGLGVGVVGLATGVALLVVGLKKKKAAGEGGGEETARVRVAPMFNANQGGLVLTGRF